MPAKRIIKKVKTIKELNKLVDENKKVTKQELKRLLNNKKVKPISSFNHDQLLNYYKVAKNGIKELKKVGKEQGIKNINKLNKNELTKKVYTNKINEENKLKVLEDKRITELIEDPFYVINLSNLYKLNQLKKDKGYKIEKQVYRTKKDKYMELLNGRLERFMIDNTDKKVYLMNYSKHIVVDKLIKTVLNYLNLNIGNNKYILQVNNKFITLNNTNINQLLEAIDNSLIGFGTEETSYGVVGYEFKNEIEQLNLIKKTPKKFIKGKKILKRKLYPDNSFDHDLMIKKRMPHFAKTDYIAKKTETGAFFNMYNKTLIDLSRYGIYTDFNVDNYKSNCLVDSLEKLGCINKVLEHMKSIMTNDNIPKKLLKVIADKYKLIIEVYSETNTNKKVYGKEGEIYKLGLLNDHYFPIEQVPITKFALENYFELMEKFNDINQIKNIKGFVIKNKRKVYTRDNRTLSSYNVIKYMLQDKNKYLKPIENNNEIQQTIYKNRINQYINELDYDDDSESVKLINGWDRDEYIEKLTKLSNYNIVFADFETLTQKKKNKTVQVADMIHKNENSFDMNFISEETFTGVDCGKYFLESLEKDSIIIFHNSSYDATFLQKYLFADSVIMKGKRLITGKYMFHNFIEDRTIKIIIKDSYAMIPTALKEFGRMFNLESSKADISHDYFNYLYKNNLLFNDDFQPIDVALTYFKCEKQKDEFINNIKKWRLYDFTRKRFNAYQYRINYCKIDVDVLKAGYNKFGEYIKEICGLNIIAHPTLASLADTFLIKQGCYNGVYELSGIVREFIQKSVVGGRTMSSENKKYIVDKQISDFDAVSLYPSAMNRMKGFLKGKPKVLKFKNYNVLKNYDGYFVEIVIKSVGIHRKFPLMSYITDEGVRNWTNDMIGKTMYVSKTTLEDLISFQDIKFDIIKGYTFNEGFNTKIKDTIKHLFDERVKQKKLKNPIQEVYKLLMNSSYGKSILKPIDTDYRIYNKDEADGFIYANYTSIKSYTKINGTKKLLIKVNKPINDHFNKAHVGSEILAMSKRIMNEVMCLSEDMDLQLFYQDTDSMHIIDSQIEILSDTFKQVYNRDLIGSYMGQFHSDFDLNGKSDGVISKKLIILGKKCYIDELYNKNTKEVGYHIRMKGIPNDSILHKCEELKINPIELYNKLHGGDTIDFDLTCGQSKSILRYKNNMTYEVIDLFSRSIKF